MKKIVSLLLLLVIPLSIYPQNEFEIKNKIIDNLRNFFSYLSDINDDEETIQPETIASYYGGDNYFYANGKDFKLVEFLTDYRSTLGSTIVNHSLNLSIDKISKTSNIASDRRWTVVATLSRESANNDDYYIKDENITIIVQWNDTRKDISILDMTFSTPLRIVYPQVRREYKFEIDRLRSNMIVPNEGGEWKISVISSYRDITYYPGVPGKDRVGRDHPATFTYQAPHGVEVKVNEATHSVSGVLRGNYSKDDRQYVITFGQEGNTKSLPVTIHQKGRKGNFFEFYSHRKYFQLDVLYSLKYNLGLSGLYTFEDSRLSLGALIAVNFDTFRAIEEPFLVSESLSVSVIGGGASDVTNGYKKSVHTDTPNTTSYSDMMDPYNEAQHYTRRMLYLLQGGIAVNHWLSFNLGLGAASAQELHFMKTAYTRTTYSYEKQDASLPDIPDVVTYTSKYKDYYYKDSTKWGFAIRPALNFHIPLNDDVDIALGAGYTFVINLKDASSFDFSVGFRWAY